MRVLDGDLPAKITIDHSKGSVIVHGSFVTVHKHEVRELDVDGGSIVGVSAVPLHCGVFISGVQGHTAIPPFIFRAAEIETSIRVTVSQTITMVQARVLGMIVPQHGRRVLNYVRVRKGSMPVVRN